jgi:hypothetical protein
MVDWLGCGGSSDRTWWLIVWDVIYWRPLEKDIVACWDGNDRSLSGMCMVAHCDGMWLLIEWDVVAHWVGCGGSLGGMWWLIGWDVMAHWAGCGGSLSGM